MTAKMVPIFVNGTPARAAAGASLSSALAEIDPDALALLLGGDGAVTDARGLPVDPDDPVHAGGIYRVARSARRDGHADG